MSWITLMPVGTEKNNVQNINKNLQTDASSVKKIFKHAYAHNHRVYKWAVFIYVQSSTHNAGCNSLQLIKWWIYSTQYAKQIK